jgi:pSer/pThr/pTyr-binding forkhead associated (FHA) protein
VRPDAWIEVVEGFCQGASYQVGRGLSLGRSFSSDVTLYDISCSLEQCRIERTCESYQIIDIGSTNGTRVNGVSLVAGRPHPLRDGDRLRMGDTLLSFRLQGSPTESGAASAEQGAWHALAEATLANRPTERLRRPRSGGPHLSGNLSRMAFAQVVQLISYAGRSGDLLLETPSGPAGVSFQRGRVHDAWFPEQHTPEESFYALARLSQGSFAFHRGERARTARIRLATRSLLLEAARRRDEE